MKQEGFNSSVEQRHIKVKKLRQWYIKIHEALQKNGNILNTRWKNEMENTGKTS